MNNPHNTDEGDSEQDAPSFNEVESNGLTSFSDASIDALQKLSSYLEETSSGQYPLKIQEDPPNSVTISRGNTRSKERTTGKPKKDVNTHKSEDIKDESTLSVDNLTSSPHPAGADAPEDLTPEIDSQCLETAPNANVSPDGIANVPRITREIKKRTVAGQANAAKQEGSSTLNGRFNDDVPSEGSLGHVRVGKSKRPRKSPKAPVVPNQPITTMIDNWAQCENCKKWRRLPYNVDTSLLPDTWTCAMNIWDPLYNSCDVPEEVINEVPLMGGNVVLPTLVDSVVWNRDHNPEDIAVVPQAKSKGKTAPKTKGGYNTRDKSARKNRYDDYNSKRGADYDDYYSYPPTSRERSSRRANYDDDLSTNGIKKDKRLNEVLHSSRAEVPDEENELIRLLISKIPKDYLSNHPLGDRLTLHSVNLTALLATELPHSALFLDNKRIVFNQEDEEKQENQNINDINKEDGHISLGLAYKTKWNSIDPDTSTIDSVDDLEKLSDLTTHRSQLFDQFPHLNNQVSNIGDFLFDEPSNFGASLCKEEAKEVSRNGGSANLTLPTDALAYSKSEGDDGEEPTLLGSIVEQEEVLNALYSFAKQHEQSKKYNYCENFKVLSTNIQSILQLKQGGKDQVYLPLELTSTPSTMYNNKKKSEDSNEANFDAVGTSLHPNRIKEALMREGIKRTYFKRIKSAHPDIDYPSPDLKKLSKRMKSMSYDHVINESDLDNSSDHSGYVNTSDDNLQMVDDLIGHKKGDSRNSSTSSLLDYPSLLFQPIPIDVVTSDDDEKRRQLFDVKVIQMLSLPIKADDILGKQYNNEPILNYNLLTLPIPNLNTIIYS